MQLTEPVHWKMSSHNMGSGWYTYGATISQLLLSKLPAGSTIECCRTRRLSGQPIISGGEADFGLGNKQRQRLCVQWEK